MHMINVIMNWLARVAFAPFASVPAWLTLTIVSALAGVFMMIVFKYTSHQTRLKAVSDRTRADLLAMKLFKDELSVTFSSMWDLLGATGKRLWYSIWPPMVVMIVPFVLGIAQVGARYEFRPLRPGERALVTLEFNEDAWAANADVQLEAPDGVIVETEAARIGGERKIFWRVRPEREGDFTLAWQIDGKRVEKSLPVRNGLHAVSPRRPASDFWEQVLYPLEPPFGKDDAVHCIDVELPRRSTEFFGLDIHWLISFFILSMVFALVCKPFLKVQL
jgi:hypothetical protein